MQLIKCVSVVAAVFLSFGLTAQSKLGLRSGIHLATVTEVQGEINPAFNPESITGFYLAAYGEFGISEKFAIQPEINYLQKGTEINGKEGESEYGLKLVVNYLEVPILAKLKMGSDKFKGYAVLGPSIGYALGGDGTVIIDDLEVTEKIEFDNDIDDDGVKDQRWDISGVIGIGGGLAMGPGDIILDIRYGLDFTDFVKFKDSMPEDHKKSYNRGLGISLGYQIPINKK